MVQEYDLVYTNVEREGFPAGTKGVVVSLYGKGPGCEVELWDESGYPIDVVTFSAEELTVFLDEGGTGNLS